jgi:hypothetical protein
LPRFLYPVAVCNLPELSGWVRCPSGRRGDECSVWTAMPTDTAPVRNCARAVWEEDGCDIFSIGVRMHAKWKELIWAFILMMVVIYLYIEVGKETELITASLRGYVAMSRPDFWPRVMLVGLLVTGLLKLFFTARKSDDRQPKQTLLKLLLVPKVMISIVIVGMYCYLSQYLGFAFSTMSFTAVYMWFLGMRRLKPLVLFPILSTLVTLVIFWRLLYVGVPKGVGIFLMFSNLIMGAIRFGA